MATPTTALNNIERVKPPTVSEFYHDYILPQKPVIIVELFDHQPVRTINTIELARQELSNLELDIQPNYVKSLFANGEIPIPKKKMTLAQYFDLIETVPSTEHFCAEYPTPDNLAALLGLPDYCKLRDETDVISNTFLANAKNYAHLHYDGDQRDVLMYQVFGVKRYVMIEPSETAKLDPWLDANVQRTSSISLENFSQEDKLAFLRYTNAKDCLLFPGETLFMPMMAWHYVEYIYNAMSVNFRLGRNKYNRFLAESIPIPSVFLQGIATKFIDERDAQEKYAGVFSRIVTACKGHYQNEMQRARCLDRLCMEIYDKTYSDSIRLPYTLREAQQREQMIREAERLHDDGEDASGDGKPQSMSPAWLDADRPELAEGVRLLSPLEDGSMSRHELYVTRNGTLEAELSSVPGAPWLYDLLVCLSKQKRMTVAALAENYQADPASIRQVLSELHLRGWVVSKPSGCFQ